MYKILAQFNKCGSDCEMKYWHISFSNPSIFFAMLLGRFFHIMLWEWRNR